MASQIDWHYGCWMGYNDLKRRKMDYAYYVYMYVLSVLLNTPHTYYLLLDKLKHAKAKNIIILNLP